MHQLQQMGGILPAIENPHLVYGLFQLQKLLTHHGKCLVCRRLCMIGTFPTRILCLRPINATNRFRKSSWANRSRQIAPGKSLRAKCDIHRSLPDLRPSCRCFGKCSPRGRHKGARCSRMATHFIAGQLPVCGQHNSQIMQMMRCEAILECGYPCDEMAPWKPHGYRLCANHWSRGKCFLMEAPTEIRLMIYRYLIPRYS